MIGLRQRIRSVVGAMRTRGLLHVMGANLVQQGVAFLGVMVLAKLLLPDEFALVRLAMAYAAMAVVLSAGGLTAPVLRYCADPGFVAQRRQLLAAGLVRLLFYSGLTALAAFAVLLVLERPFLDKQIFSAYALQIPFLAATSLLMVYLQAVQRFRFLAYSQLMIRSVSFVVALAATWIFGLNGFLVATVATVSIGALYLMHVSAPMLRGSRPTLPEDFHLLAKYSLFGTAITTAGQYADLMMLDWVGVNKVYIAVYSLATVFFFAAGSLVGAAQSVATPAFTAVINDPNTLRTQLRRWTGMLTAAGAATAVAVTVLAWLVERHFLGDGYAGLWQLVAILMLRFCLWCAYAMSGAMLLGIGAIKQGTWLALVSCTLALVVGYPLCLVLGVWGAAWTQVIVALVTGGLVWFIVWVELRRLSVPGCLEARAEAGGTPL